MQQHQSRLQPTIKQIADVLTASVEKKYVWHRCANEAYGLALPADDSISENLLATKVLLCVTATSEVEYYAKLNNYGLVVSHHPMHIDFPQVVLHTALDCCPGGINDLWAELLGLDMEKAHHFDGTLGWRGKFKAGAECLFDDFVKKVEGIIGSPPVGICKSNREKGIVWGATICSGLGGLVVKEATDYNCSTLCCYVTGELCHSEGLQYFGYVIETGHTLSERIILPKLKDIIVRAFPDVQVDIAPIEIDYFGREVL